MCIFFIILKLLSLFSVQFSYFSTINPKLILTCIINAYSGTDYASGDEESTLLNNTNLHNCVFVMRQANVLTVTNRMKHQQFCTPICSHVVILIRFHITFYTDPMSLYYGVAFMVTPTAIPHAITIIYVCSFM